VRIKDSAALELRDASFRYPQAEWLFKDLSRTFRAGSSTSIQGRSGSGKSTLISLLGLLRAPTAGEVLINGTTTRSMPDQIASRLRGSLLGFVFQESHLADNRAVWKSVAMPLLLQGSTRSASRRRAVEALEKVELGGFEDRKPDELSGGQRQRCAVARAIVTHPRIVIADEPTGSLDERTADIVGSVLFGLAAGENVALIVVTHDKSVAQLADNQLMLTNGRLV
jgi:putative ABC transport system ATP-binding protein